MKNLLQDFAAKPFAGRFLVISEYRDAHGGGTACVPDLISVDQDIFDDPQSLLEDELYVGVFASCDSALWDSLVEFEVWPNGEVYLGGDGVNHDRYRVTGIYEFESVATLAESSDLTDMHGIPVWWCVDQFEQESHPDKEGVKVEMGIWHNLTTMRPGWEFRKAFGDQMTLFALADAEFEKPKYASTPRAIRVDGRVVKSWSADHMAPGHELQGKKND